MENDLLHRFTIDIIRIDSATLQRGQKFTGREILSVEAEFVELAMKHTIASLPCCRAEVSELSHPMFKSMTSAWTV